MKAEELRSFVMKHLPQLFKGQGHVSATCIGEVVEYEFSQSSNLVKQKQTLPDFIYKNEEFDMKSTSVGITKFRGKIRWKAFKYFLKHNPWMVIISYKRRGVDLLLLDIAVHKFNEGGWHPVSDGYIWHVPALKKPKIMKDEDSQLEEVEKDKSTLKD